MQLPTDNVLAAMKVVLFDDPVLQAGLRTASGYAWICIILGSWLDPDPIQIKTKNSGAVEAQQMDREGACRRLFTDSHHFDEEQDPDPQINVKSRIRFLH